MRSILLRLGHSISSAPVAAWCLLSLSLSCLLCVVRLSRRVSCASVLQQWILLRVDFNATISWKLKQKNGHQLSPTGLFCFQVGESWKSTATSPLLPINCWASRRNQGELLHVATCCWYGHHAWVSFIIQHAKAIWHEKRNCFFPFFLFYYVQSSMSF